jgi:hypothetical protein
MLRGGNFRFLGQTTDNSVIERSEAIQWQNGLAHGRLDKNIVLS